MTFKNPLHDYREEELSQAGLEWVGTVMDVPVFGSVIKRCASLQEFLHLVKSRDVKGRLRGNSKQDSLTTWTEQWGLTSLIEKQMMGIVPMITLDCLLANSRNMTCPCFIGVPSLSYTSLQMMTT